MKEIIILIRNKIIGWVYRYLLKPVLFLFDPEMVHDSFIWKGKIFGSNIIFRKLTGLLFDYKNSVLEQEVLGIKFKNPIGLAAGFDKDAELTNILPAVGFGFAEVGSITGEPCLGNPKPRLWRLKKSKAIVVYYGLKNNGAERIVNKLKNKKFRFPVGISVAKTNSPGTCEIDKGIADYSKAFSYFVNIGDYITINISCPNAYGGQPFTDSEKLDSLLSAIDKIEYSKPIFIKLNPDLSKIEVDNIINIVRKHRIDGFVCTNLTQNRDNKKIIESEVPEDGGISGGVVKDLSLDMVKYVYQRTKGEYVIIGCGGISSAKDAYQIIKAGASLVQLITSMIFAGPQVISEINQGLVKLLKQDGYNNICQAVGRDNK